MTKHESLKRIVIKGVSWEVVSNLVCLGLAYKMFGNLGSCLTFTFFCIGIKFLMFIPHEKLWELISLEKETKL